MIETIKAAIIYILVILAVLSVNFGALYLAVKIVKIAWGAL